MNHIFKNIFTLIGICLVQFVSAGIEPVLRNSMESASIRTDSFRVIEDIQYTNTNLGAYNLYKAQSFVHLEINQDQLSDCYLDSFSFSATVEVKGWDETGTSTTENITLQVRYDQLLGATYKAIETKEYEGFYKLQITVISVSDVALTPYIRISGEIALERYKTLDYSSTPTFSSASYNSTTGNVTASWSSITGAEEYDLEYTFIDDYAYLESTYLTTSDLTPNFQGNSSRVRVKGNSYSLSNVFEHGYVVFRVRGVGRHGANFTHVVSGKWSNIAYNSTLNNYPSSNYVAVTPVNPTLNWQYVITFAEEGKNKELISFMDGSFRSRQSITRISSDTTLIVGESIYDYQGRPAMQIIPVPIDQTIIAYQANFSKISDTSDNYSAKHFDTGWCLPDPIPLSTQHGAGKYYSTNNEFLSNSNHWLADHNPYIPDANGYVFTRTIYTPDNSGRVAAQSGIGEEHALGSGHETKYYYGTPFQEELDKLFGNHVGHVEHYQKQMVVDPNGQVSVSYTDLSGKVIATALAGSTPDHTDILANNDGIHEVEVNFISNAGGSGSQYENTISKSINVAVPGSYRLSYLLEVGEYEDNCLTDCYECVYDLSMSVKNECGEELLDGDLLTSGIQAFTRQIKRSEGEGFSLSCSTDTIFYKFTDDVLVSSDSIRITLPVGSYVITKVLSVSNEAAEYYADQYLATASCVQPKEDFDEYFNAIIDDFGCDVTCTECSEMLADSSSYVSSRKTAYINLGYADDASLLGMVAAEYSAKKAVCEQVCDGSVSPCEFQKVILEVDVSSDGQYSNLNGDITQHPEYCHYEFCLNNSQAFRYEERLNDQQNGNEAIQSGYMDPLENQALFSNGAKDSFFTVGPGTLYNAGLATKLANAATLSLDGSHVLNVWELSIYSAFCEQGTTWTEVSSCISGYSYNPNANQARNSYAFNLFRASYLKFRKEILDSIKYASSSYCQNITIPTGKERRFLDNDQIEDLFPSGQVAMEAEALTRCENFCDSTSQSWMEILGPCVMDHPSKEAIRLALVDVCQRGCDGYNPMGAKTVTPGNFSGSLPNSFKEVLEDYGIFDPNACNDAVVSSVPERKTSVDYSSNGIGIDNSCQCAQEQDTSLLSISDPELRMALEQINYIESDTVCTTCATCEQVYQAYDQFYQKHGAVNFEGDSTISIWPNIFTNEMNSSLGFTLGFEDYREFIASCLNNSDSSLDMEDLLVIYRTDFDWVKDFEFSKNLDASPNPSNLFSDQLWKPQLIFSDVASVSIESINMLDPYDPPLTITPCFCIALELGMNGILNDTNYTASDTNNLEAWAAKGYGCVADNIDAINLLKEVCRQAFHQNKRSVLDNMTNPNAWSSNPKMINDLTELSFKNNARIPMLCLQGFDPCDVLPGDYWLNYHYDPDSVVGGVPLTSGKLTCTDIRNGVDDVMTDNSWTKITAVVSSYWRIANYIDSLYSEAPYFREGYWQDSTYRIDRIISEISQCIIEDPCYRTQYFDTCSSSFCSQSNSNVWMMRNFVNAMVKPRQTGYTNYLDNKEWTHSTESVTALSSSGLYTGSSPSTLKNIFDPAIQYNESGKPRYINFTDNNGYSIDFTIAFRGVSGQHYYGDITQILSFKPIYFGPCDSSTLRFNMLAIMKTGTGLDTLWLFGQTDSFDYLTTCGSVEDELTLCNKPYFEVSDNPCGIDLTAMADRMATTFYESYLDSIRKAFIHSYKTQCYEKSFDNEIFRLRFNQQEYHYTLYYYDQAGNLIQTVPPQGVNFLNSTQVTQSMNFRNGIGTAYYPSHNLNTEYNYNSLNELVWQSTPDGGESNFWYDRLGRLVVSQNGKQLAAPGTYHAYSYTTYDELGRIAEVGEISPTSVMTTSIAQTDLSLFNWIDYGTTSQITKTYYDEAPSSVNYNGFEQTYLRNRVATTTFTTTEGATDYQSAVHYDYDVHGNVKAMVRETPGLDSIFEQYKIIRYEYELVSGNVLKVLYQTDSIDRFFHKYEYDSDNRVIGAFTSTDQIHWDRDAKYMYYLHGPLARMELGELRVQGMDYAYTIHGWLKGVNSNRLRTGHDIGKDGNSSSTNEWVCKDVFGFSLGYFDEDFSRIGSVTLATNWLINQSGSMLQDTGRELFNGNISTMVTSISKFMEQGDVPMGRAFQYDQLNRIKASRAFNNVDTADNEWNLAGGPLTQYATNYTYDANGNILSLARKGKSTQPNMDELSYHYYSGTNRLEYVDDAITSTNYGIDIDDQSSGNYDYDEIGNLISDASEEIDEITWTVYGKIQSITRTGGSTKPSLEFEYSPDGHRSAKHVTDPSTGFTTSTWYVRDASGNIMATYDKTVYTALDTSAFTFEDLNDIVYNDWGASVFARFLTEALDMHNVVDVAQYTTMRNNVITNTQEETFLKMNDPRPILDNDATLASNAITSYSNSDFMSAMLGHYGTTEDFVKTAILPSCGSGFISYLIQTHQSAAFLEYLFGFYSSEATDLWAIYGTGGSYPGNTGASFYFNSTAPTPQFQDDFANFLIGYGNENDFIDQFTSYFSSSTLQADVQAYSGYKGCAFITLGSDLYTILDLYDRSLLWDNIISNSSYSSLLTNLSIYDSQAFLKTYLTLYPTEASDLMTNSPQGGYYVTDYLKAILNYESFGGGYYENVINQLMSLGFVTGGWNYTAGEHHIYGSSRIGVHQTNILMRTRYASGDISITLEDEEFTQMYRGKRHYELSNHLGNVQVVVSDKRVSICDEYLGVERFEAEVLSAMDYYPFGMMMPDRQWYASSDSSNYRFGFNGKDRDNQISGQGNNLDFGARIYDSRLGRMLSLDPLTFNYPSISPYAFAENDVIRSIDFEGLGKVIVVNSKWYSKRIKAALDLNTEEGNKEAIRLAKKAVNLSAPQNDPEAFKNYECNCAAYEEDDGQPGIEIQINIDGKSKRSVYKSIQIDEKSLVDDELITKRNELKENQEQISNLEIKIKETEYMINHITDEAGTVNPKEIKDGETGYFLSIILIQQMKISEKKKLEVQKDILIKRNAQLKQEIEKLEIEDNSSRTEYYDHEGHLYKVEEHK